MVQESMVKISSIDLTASFVHPKPSSTSNRVP